MLRLIGSLLLFSSLLIGCSEQGPPCDVLAERLCAVSDEAFCGVLTKQAEEKRADASKQKECRAVLDDEHKLREVLDGVKAATRFQVEAKKPSEKKPKRAAEERKPNAVKKPASSGAKAATPPKASKAPPSAPPAAKPGSAATAK